MLVLEAPKVFLSGFAPLREIKGTTNARDCETVCRTERFCSCAGLPGTPFEIELPEGSTLQDVVAHLNLPEEEVKITFVNGIIQEMDCELKSGDEIGIFPPVGGG